MVLKIFILISLKKILMKFWTSSKLQSDVGSCILILPMRSACTDYTLSKWLSPGGRRCRRDATQNVVNIGNERSLPISNFASKSKSEIKLIFIIIFYFISSHKEPFFRFSMSWISVPCFFNVGIGGLKTQGARTKCERPESSVPYIPTLKNKEPRFRPFKSRKKVPCVMK